MRVVAWTRRLTYNIKDTCSTLEETLFNRVSVSKVSFLLDAFTYSKSLVCVSSQFRSVQV